MTAKPVEDVICVIEVSGHYRFEGHMTRRTVEKSGWLGREQETISSTPFTSSGGCQKRGRGKLDYPDIPATLARIEALEQETAAHIKNAASLSGVEKIIENSQETTVWLGTAAQFEPHPSDTSKLWAKKDAKPPVTLKGPISAWQLKKALRAFNTACRHAHDEHDRQRRLKRDVHNATVLQETVKVRKPMAFRK